MNYSPMDSIHPMHEHPAGFAAMWSPGLLLATILIGFIYFYFIGPMRSRFTGSSPVPIRKKLYMITALLLFYGAQGSPIGYYSHTDLFSAHMLQQSIIYLMIPPLVILALPTWFIRPLFMKRWMRKWIYPITQPLVAVLVFNLMFSLYHIPLVFNFAFDRPALHLGYHIFLAIAAFHMWFPIFCPIPEWNRISDLQKMAYVFVNGVLLTPACALIIFAKTLLFPGYAAGTEALGLLSPLDDQQLGGTLMKIFQEIVYGVTLAYIFFKWYNREKREDYDEQVTMDRLNHEKLIDQKNNDQKITVIKPVPQ